MKIPEHPMDIGNTTVFINGTNWPILLLTVIPGAYSELSRLGFNWTFVSFAPSWMQIKLNFENPLEVSSHTQYYDQMQIKVLGFYLFADFKGNLMMPEYIIKDRILTQISTPSLL